MRTTKKIVSFFVLVSFILLNIAPVSAQSIAVLGEVKASGKVSIESTSGQWISAPATYPLLQNTGIKTDDGSAALFFKDGSRIDLSKNSLALVDGSGSQYTVQMAKGILAFNMAPGASLSVQTASTTVSVNKKNSVVQKVSMEKSGRILGVISSSEKGTEVRCITGRIAIEVTPTETKLLTTGESIFVDANSAYKVFNTQTFPPETRSSGPSSDYTGAYILTGTALASYIALCRGYASPSHFCPKFTRNW